MQLVYVRFHGPIKLAVITTTVSWSTGPNGGPKPADITMLAPEGRSLSSSAGTGSSGLDIPQSLAPTKKTGRRSSHADRDRVGRAGPTPRDPATLHTSSSSA